MADILHHQDILAKDNENFASRIEIINKISDILRQCSLSQVEKIRQRILLSFDSDGECAIIACKHPVGPRKLFCNKH